MLPGGRGQLELPGAGTRGLGVREGSQYSRAVRCSVSKQSSCGPRRRGRAGRAASCGHRVSKAAEDSALLRGGDPPAVLASPSPVGAALETAYLP